MHKRLFSELNTGALNSAFVVSRYKASERTLPVVLEMKVQFKETSQLHYEHIVLNKEVPGDIDTSKLKFIHLLPLSLVSKLGLVEKLRSEPAAGARELVTAQKRKATAAAKKKLALSKTNQGQAASPEFSGVKKTVSQHVSVAQKENGPFP